MRFSKVFVALLLQVLESKLLLARDLLDKDRLMALLGLALTQPATELMPGAARHRSPEASHRGR